MYINKAFSLFFLLIILFSTNTHWVNAQGYPHQEFRSPLGIPLVLAGTFGELRSNHFHAGLDIKTNGAEGYRIYAVADGYVSRIKVQAGGYGKAIYVTHPNGYTSVYCHLSKFGDGIANYVESRQYEQQSFEVDLYLPAGEIYVNKSQIIALSGNSGSSSAPHLHFEIRRTADEHPMNPLQFFNVADTKKPTLVQAGIVAINDQNILSDNTVYFKKEETPNLIKLAQPRIGVSLHTFDLLNDAPNKNGVYSIKMFNNGNLVYEYKMDEFSFSESRYLNSHIHYPAYCEHRRREHRCYKEPANRLNNYKTLVNNGIVDLYDGQIHVLKFEIADFKGNTTFHNLNVQYNIETGRQFYFPTPTAHGADYGFPYTLQNSDFVFETNEASLYNKLYLEYTNNYAEAQPHYSAAHTVSPSCYAFHKPCTVKLRPFQFDESVRGKLLIAQKSDKGYVSGLKSEWEFDYLVASTKAPGTFYVTADFDAPTIRPKKNYRKGSFKNGHAFKFQLADNLSGIKSYNAYINGSWVLLDYDAKSRTITHTLNNRTSKGIHDCLIIIEDICGNSATYQFSFTKI